MAQRNMWAAAEVAEKHEDIARSLDVSTEEAAEWRDAATHNDPLRRAAGRSPAARGLHPARGLGLRPHTGKKTTRSCCTTPTSTCTGSRSSKQADLVLAIQMRGDAFTAEQKARDFAYYEPLTVRDSSLSACTQAVVAAEVGQLELAHETGRSGA